MSILTWKQKFFKNFEKACETELKAVEHAIIKWEGLLPENMRLHHVERDTDEVNACTIKSSTDSGKERQFFINADTCALCKRHSVCSDCSLFDMLGERCYSHGILRTRPFDVWELENDPRPMIKALKQLKKRLLKKR